MLLARGSAIQSNWNYCPVHLLAASVMVPVFRSFPGRPKQLSWAENWAVVIPLSIYTGWTIIATFANTSALLHQHGLLNVLLSPAWWTVVMVLLAGFIAADWIHKSANPAFALTVCWALVGILVANLTREYHPQVVFVCAAMTLFELAVLRVSRRHS